MKKFSYRSAAQRKRSLKYGGYATITTLILLAVLVLVNVLFNQLGWNVDLTPQDLYTPGSQTLQILDSLEDDVTIYGLYNQGTEDNETNTRVIKLVEAYCDLNSHLTFTKIDPLSNPDFANQFLADTSDTLENGSLVVQNQTTGKFKTIPISNMYETTDDYSTLTRKVTGFTAEEALTSAIQYVCLQETPVLYQLQGHSESLLSDEFKDYLSYSNYAVNTMTSQELVSGSLEATKYNVLLVNNPRTDLNDAEYEVLLDYMENGGRMLFLAANDTPDLPNFARLLSRYGLSLQTGTMVETDQNHYYTYPFIILPEMNQDSDIAKYLVNDSNNYVVMTLPAAVNISSETDNSLKVEAFMTTSDGAIIKQGDNSAVVYEDGDLKGPFNLAVSAEEQVTLDDGVGTSKLVVVGNSDFLNSDTGSVVTTGNYKIMAIVCDYLQDSTSQLYISAKDISDATISTTSADFFGCALVFIILIPAVIIICGVVIYMRRKHR